MAIQKHFFLYFMSKVTSYPADYQMFPTLFELELVAGFADADDTKAAAESLSFPSSGRAGAAMNNAG